MKVEILVKGRGDLLATNLTASEFDCPCKSIECHFTLVSSTLLDSWIRLRTHWGRPLLVTSGFRCQTHNSSTGVTGIAKSMHTLGCAIDISLGNQDTDRLIEMARSCFPFVKVYPSFMHCDTRGI